MVRQWFVRTVALRRSKRPTAVPSARGRAGAAGWGAAASDAVTSCHLPRPLLRDEMRAVNRYDAAARTRLRDRRSKCVLLDWHWPACSRSPCRSPRQPAGRGRICGNLPEGRRQTSCWCGMAAVRAGTQALLPATAQRIAPNGMDEGLLLIGSQVVTITGVASTAARGCRLTGSGFPEARSLMIPSQTGEARRAAGVIPSWRAATSAGRKCLRHPRDWYVPSGLNGSRQPRA